MSNTVKHVSVRFAWHDDNWSGKICVDPKRNIYCRGNYSLLTARIQRRIKLEIEEDYRGQEISNALKEQQYLPPCYWCINALGNKDYLVKDTHPFGDFKGWLADAFRREVPPLEWSLDRFSVFTWYFRLGFAEDDYQRYVPIPELERRVKEYLEAIQEDKSIAFFYTNFSNPITGDDYKYLLLGAGLVRGKNEPQEYKIPDELHDKTQSLPHMENTPKLAWQLQILLEPNLSFVLPYHEYIAWFEEADEIEKGERWKQLKDIAIPVEESTIVDHFKYVSRLLPSDKCIYLLYLIRKSLEKMKGHGIVQYSKLEAIEKKLESLLQIAWKERGEYPGFKIAVQVFLARAQIFGKKFKSVTRKVEEYIKQNFGSVEEFFKARKYPNASTSVSNALRIIERDKDRIEFLSLFEFTAQQFRNILKILDKVGLETAKKNPYVLLENYHFDEKDHWRMDESDYGISLFQFDTALIPDPKYVDREISYDALSPERLRCVITKILKDTGQREGVSYLTREEIIQNIKEYPLYYITEKLSIDAHTLSKYEKQAVFKDKFLIKKSIVDGEVDYQLREIEEIEKAIERFVDRLSRKEHSLAENDTIDVQNIVKDEHKRFKDKLNVETEKLFLDERNELYPNTLKSGLFVLSGKAGSGKTTAVINLITKFRKDRKLPIYVFTPTGKASLVILNRLKELDLHREKQIYVSTIHRFLYRGFFDYRLATGERAREIRRLRDLIDKILNGKLWLLKEFRLLAERWKSNPKVVIIDEASMVDEILLFTLLSLINPDVLEHLIVVGDERQLPPIGIGKPLVDTIFYVKKIGLEEKTMRLESNLRFDPTTRLGKFSDLFGGEEQPFPTEIEDALGTQKDNADKDDTLETRYYMDEQDLKNIVLKQLYQVGDGLINDSIFDVFKEIFEMGGTLNLDSVQILSPRRMGDFGSQAINMNVVLDGNVEFLPGTKLICEHNIYHNLKDRRGWRRILGLANGSIGYIEGEREISFDDIETLKAEYIDDIYAQRSIEFLERKIEKEIFRKEGDRRIDLGYAITVHKSQGSDFDHVLLVLSDLTPFTTRELLYTAFTRPRKKLHLLIHDKLRDNLPIILSNAYENSSIERRKTLLFGHKTSPFKPYLMTRKDGKTIELRSKIECIIAKALDENEIHFEPEPKEFLQEFRLIPDFKLFVNDNVYYWEHLGLMKNISYRERWYRKLEIYKKIGISGTLITTSESEEKANVEQNIKKILDDIKSMKLRKTEGGYSAHHYYI